MTQTQTCPCGSNLELSACCLPFIQGKKKAATAEQLLRARYTAFTRGDIDFILATHHPETRGEVKREEIEEWSKNSEWKGMQLYQAEAGGEKDEEGRIIFCAKFSAEGKDHEHWEQSIFKKDKGEWYFLDAREVRVGPYVREEPKIGRNDPCPCKSGKKYKKCCGAA